MKSSLSILLSPLMNNVSRCFLLISIIGISSGHAQLVFGPSALTTFELLRDLNGDSFEDFNSFNDNDNLSSGQVSGVTFESVTNVFGTAQGPFHVEVSNAFSSTTSQGLTIVGAPGANSTDDGRVGYEITFDTVQHRAGLLRIWNTSTTTEFLDVEGNSLAFHQNTTGTEFVGYLADFNDTNTWIKTIKIDTAAASNNRQVGYSDDLFFGSTTIAVPEPATYALFFLGGAICLAYLRRR